MNALLLIHLGQVGNRFVVAVGLESIKAEFLVRARRSRGDASSLKAPDQSRFQAFGLHRLLDIEPLLAPSTDREIKITGKPLSLEGPELTFVKGPGIAHEHGENRAQKDDLISLMAEPENRPPTPLGLTLIPTPRIFYSLSK